MQYEPANMGDDIDALLSASASKLARSADLEAFLGWIADAGPLLAPSLAAQVDPQTGPIGQFFRTLGVGIYNNTPLPDRDFALAPIPKPERNQFCLCGSGRKYKHCCLAIDPQPILANYNMLRHVLDHCPKRVFAALPNTRVDSEAVANTAEQWWEEGETRRALALLEPWFKPNIPLTRRQRPLFDLLMDLYLDLGNSGKRQRLVERVRQADDKPLRADALQRQATILMDQGKPEAAWKCFKEAQRAEPNTPSLAMLEITLLCATNEIEQAKARAVFWLAHFRPRKDLDPEFVAMLARCAEDPEEVFRLSGNPIEAMPEVIIDLLDNLTVAPAPSARYTLELHDNEAMLLADKTLMQIERTWSTCFDHHAPSLTQVQHDNLAVWEHADNWLSLLRRQPELWQSFSVIDDSVMAVDALQMDELTAVLLDPLLDRALALLDLNFEKAVFNETYSLPWIILENRPALRLLTHKIFLLQHQTDGRDTTFVKLAERLLALNPNDNHGIRLLLSTAYIADGQFDKAIAIADRFPDEVLCTLPLNKVLAFYLDNQTSKALKQLSTVAQQFTVAINMLLARAPRPPQLSPNGVTLGGKDEAWYYREATLMLWRQRDALGWLKGAMTQIKNR